MVQGSINQFPSESLFLSPIISNLIFLLKLYRFIETLFKII